MARPRPRIGSELFPVAMILACLAGTLFLVVSMHRRVVPARREAKPPPVAVAIAAPAPEPEPEPEPPPPLPKPAAPPEDPTKPIVARLAAQTAAQIESAQQADRRAAALERAEQAALADSRRWRQRELLVRAQIDEISQRAESIERAADSLAIERDALERERDKDKAALAKARTRSSYAVLPHKGPNGTWRRPIMLECRNGTVKLQPNGPTFTLLDLAGPYGIRSSPFVMAVARELVHAQAQSSPDGAPSVPYIYFVIRPDGIRPYYEARGRLETLGIAFGYELVEQEMEIDYPDLDNLDEWDSPAPTRPGAGLADGSKFSWPADRPQGNAPGRPGEPDGGLMWPTQPRGGSGTVAGGDPALQPFPAGSGRGSGRGVVLLGDPSGSGTGRGMVALGDPSGSGGSGPIGSDPALHPGRRAVPLSGDPGMGGSGDVDRELDERFGHPPTSDGAYAGGGGGGQGSGGQGNDRAGDPFDPGGLPDDPTGRLGGSPSGGSAGSSFGQRPGLVPVDPNGLPGFEAPSASQSGGRPFAPSGRPGGSGTASSSSSGQPDGSGSGFGSPTAASGQPGGSRTGFGPLSGATGQPGGSGTAYASPFAPTGRPDASGTEAGAADLGAAAGGSPPLEGSTGSQSGGSGSSGNPTGGSTTSGGQKSSSSSPGDPSSGSPPALTMNGGSGSSGGSPGQVGIGMPSPGAGSGSPPQGGGAAGSSRGSPGQVGMGLPSPGGGSDSPSQASGRKGVSSSIVDPKKISVPFEMVVACGPNGIVIHPGGYRLSTKSLETKSEAILVKDLKTVLRNRQEVDPMIRPRPSVRFLIEAGGSETYWKAQRQYVLSGITWPTTIQVGSTSVMNLFPTERR